jgi:hypothetical protein
MMPGPTYGMTTEQLNQIINATSESITRMHGVWSQVYAHASSIVSVNNSDSGRITQRDLETWSNDYSKIVGDLEALNEKVTRLRDANLSTTDEAADRATRARA